MIRSSSVFGVAILLGIASAAPVPKDIAPIFYFPVAKGTKWVWQHEDSRSEIVQAIARVEMKDGVYEITVDQVRDDGKMVFDEQWKVSTDGLYQTKNTSPIRVKSPLCFLKTPYKIGASWDFPGILGVPATITIENIERIKVPAGEFDSVKVVQRDNGELPLPVTRWYVRGIGMVKFQYCDGETYSLKSFTPGKP